MGGLALHPVHWQHVGPHTAITATQQAGIVTSALTRAPTRLQVLNLLLYALRRQDPDAPLMEFLLVDEHLVDIGDDLVDYEGDVMR
jgi:hypothetical protein